MSPVFLLKGAHGVTAIGAFIVRLSFVYRPYSNRLPFRTETDRQQVRSRAVVHSTRMIHLKCPHRHETIDANQ